MLNESTLLSTLKRDLKIKQFQNEIESQYCNRIIYTTGACWARSLLLDKSLSNISDSETDIVHGVGRLHISERLTKIIYGLIRILPCDYKRNNIENDDYLLTKSKEIANDIIRKMKYCYEISDVDGRFLTTKVQRLGFNNKTLILGGNECQSNSSLIFTGIGKWSTISEKDKSYHELWDIPESHVEYLKSLIENIPLKESSIPDDILIYKYHNGGYGITDKFWSNQRISKLSSGVYIGKTESGKLYLINKDNNDIRSILLNEWYLDTMTYMRIIYASANVQGFIPSVKVHIESDHVELSPNCILPKPENRIIRLSSWEVSDSNNKTIKIIPIEIWNEISEIFINLGISIKEI